METDPQIVTDRVRKFKEDLESERASLATCAQLFTTLSNHFNSLQESLDLRNKSVESKLHSLESTSRQALDSLAKREASIPQLEAEAVDCVRERKQAAIADIEKPNSNPGLAETLRSLAMRMESREMVMYMIRKRKEAALIRAELKDAVNAAIDPPRLVLDALEEFLERKAVGKAGIIDKRWAVSLLVHALFPDVKPGSPTDSGYESVSLGSKFARKVVERAWGILEKWRGQIGSNEEGSEIGKFGPVEAVVFLTMLLGFGLKPRFSEEFLKKMLMEFSSRRDIAKLAPCFVFGQKLADMIDELVKMGKEIDAVYFAIEAGFTERFSPVSLLKSFLKRSRKNATDALKKGNNSAAMAEESSNIELTAIKAVVKCVEDQKLESVFSVDALKKKANALEKARSEKKNNAGSFPSSSKPSGKRSHSSVSSKGSAAQLRPAKAAKLLYQQRYRFDRIPVPAPPRQPSPVAVRYSRAQFAYPSHDAYEVNGTIAYTPTPSSYGVAHTHSLSSAAAVAAAAGMPQQYSPMLGNSPSGGSYQPPLYGEQGSYSVYDYGSVGQQAAYHPTNPSYTQ